MDDALAPEADRRWRMLGTLVEGEYSRRCIIAPNRAGCWTSKFGDGCMLGVVHSKQPSLVAHGDHEACNEGATYS